MAECTRIPNQPVLLHVLIRGGEWPLGILQLGEAGVPKSKCQGAGNADEKC